MVKNNSGSGKQPCILIMAGGTGGHVFPALAVAHRLRSLGWEVHWLGTKSGLEADIVPRAGFSLHYISITGLRRKGILTRCLVPFRIVAALYQSLKALRTLRPQVVLGMGGFVAGPGGVAAWLTRCPLVIHEQNAIAGFTNRCLALLATRILEGFPNTFKASLKAVYTGNPVRLQLLDLPLPTERFTGRKGSLRLLVLGGSRGAAALNQICPQAIQKMPVDKRPEIVHQAGAGHAEAAEKQYQQAGVAARVQPFIDDMASAYAWADLVLCRAGALTIAELATVGVGSILVPYPYAVDDHQTANGRFLEQKGAAKIIPQSALDAETLANTVLALWGDRNRVLEMANAAYQGAHRDALHEVTAHCEEIGNRVFKQS